MSARNVSRVLACMFLLASLAACGGGGGDSTPSTGTGTTTAATPTTPATNAVTLASNVTTLDATRAAGISQVSAGADGATQLSVPASGALAASLQPGTVISIPAGVDARFPLGLAARVSTLTNPGTGTAVVTLAPATLADVATSASLQAQDIALNSENFVGAIAPSAVRASTAAAGRRLAFWETGTTALDGGVMLRDKPGRAQALARSLFGDTGSIDVGGEISLDVSLDLMSLTRSLRITPYGQRSAEAKLSLAGTLKNLKLSGNYDYAQLFGFDAGLRTLGLRVTGDLSAEAKLSGNFETEIGQVGELWESVESSQLKTLGVASASLTGLESKDKAGKFPIVGLVFSVACGATCPVVRAGGGGSEAALQAAKPLGVIVWVYVNAKGKLSLDGEVGVRVTNGRLSVGMDLLPPIGLVPPIGLLPAGGWSSADTAPLRVEAPFVNATAALQTRLGLSLEADFFALGVRAGNAGLFVGTQVNGTFSGALSNAAPSFSGPWTLDGSGCLSSQRGYGAIFSADLNLGVKITSTWILSASGGFQYSMQSPTNEEMLGLGYHQVLGVNGWYTDKQGSGCYPTPVVRAVEQTRPGGSGAQLAVISVYGSNLPTDLSLTVTPDGACARVQPVNIGVTTATFSCTPGAGVSSFGYALTSTLAQNMDTSALSGLSAYAPRQTVNIAQLIDDVGAVQGPVVQNGSTDDSTPTLAGDISAVLGAGQMLRIYDGPTTILGTADVNGTRWTFTAPVLANGTHTFRAVVSTVDGVEGAPSAGWAVTLVPPATGTTPGNPTPTPPVVPTTPTPTAVPATPGAVFLASGNSAVLTLTWAAVADAGYYQLLRNATPIGGSITATVYADATVAPNITYSYQVKACNAVGCSGAGAAFSITLAAVPVTLVPLNDTGITASQCYQAGSDTLVACASAGALGLNSSQDGMAGRDASGASNTGTDGRLGFSFTKIGATGETLAAGAASWTCVKDNTTGLVWEVKTADGALRDRNKTYTNYDDATQPQKSGGINPAQAEIDAATNAVAFRNAVNAATLCGASDWRLPTVDELQSLIDYGVASPGPTIDATWFPNTVNSASYWASTPAVGIPTEAWVAAFSNGTSGGSVSRGVSGAVRLVRP